MGWWQDQVVPRMANKMLDTEWVHQQRALTCQGLEGRVLEIGFGSGLNVRHYPAAVDEVSAVEPSDVAWAMAQPRLVDSPAAVRRSGMDGQSLAEADASFDHALSSFTMCAIPDHTAALAEVYRVLRPGGTFHFVEHGLSPDPGVQKWQHRLEPMNRRMAGGYRLTRPHDRAIAGAGFDVVEMENLYEPGPSASRPFGYVYRGVAVKHR